ncbi:MAG: hypothetical protein JNL84_02870 [Candidatus Accumulibacter sp.]|nr:hypothetical protein [Accumulibacter sp.]
MHPLCRCQSSAQKTVTHNNSKAPLVHIKRARALAQRAVLRLRNRDGEETGSTVAARRKIGGIEPEKTAKRVGKTNLAC